MYFTFEVVATLALAGCLTAVRCDSFPSTISKCRFGDVNCLKNKVNELVQSSPGGIPELHLGSIDPFYIGKITLEQGASTSPVNVKIRMKNATMVGIKNARVTKVVGFEKNPNTTQFEIYVSCPEVTITGNYQMSGKALVVPVQGQGLAKIVLHDNNSSIKMVTHTVNRNGLDYVFLDNILYSSVSKRMSSNFDNLFNDPVISENMNKFFNDNQDILLAELNPSMNSIFANIMKKKLRPVFENIPYQEFFLE